MRFWVAALRDATSELGTREAKMVAQHPQQRHGRISVHAFAIFRLFVVGR